MKNSPKKPTELVVIFKKRTNLSGITIYKPVSIEFGYFDKESNLFVTINKEKFHYLLNEKYLYGFGLRQPIKQIKQQYPILKSIKMTTFIQKYLTELKKYDFYFQVSPNPEDVDFLCLMAKNKKTKKILSIEADEDLEKTKKAIINSDKIHFNTQSLIDGIKSEVIGQDEAIEDIVSIIWQNLRSNNGKSNILLMGATGVGKTEIIRNITKRLNIPMIIVNATDLTQAGYIGAKATDFLAQLLKQANYDIKKASRGIIFIDEIDKKAGHSNSEKGEVATTGAQDELLKLLEDGTYNINISTNPFAPKIVTINTKNITFICSGAFPLMKEIKEEANKKQIGFLKDSTEKQSKTTPEDLINYGLKPELVGRLPNIIELNSLNKENLITIMKNPNNKTIQEKINILSNLEITTTIEEEVYSLLADKALKQNTGARGLISVVEKLFIKAMLEVSKHPDDYSQLIIDKNTIDNSQCYTLIRKKKK